MKSSYAVLALVLLPALAVTSRSQAQSASPSAASQPSTPAPPARSFRLLWTIEESDSGKHISTQHFEMVVTTGGRTTTKLGSKVPVVTGSYSGNSSVGVQTQFQYLDVGLNLDASLDDTPTGMRLRSKVEQSSVAEDKTNTGTAVAFHEPIIRQAVMEGTSLLTVGKTVTLGSLDVPGSTHHLDISVTLENVK